MEAAAYPSPRLLAPAVVTAGALAIVAVLWLTWTAAPLVWAVPAALALGLGLALGRPDPLVSLAGVLALQVFQLGGDDGVEAGEAVAGLALVAYLAHWYLTTWLEGRRVVTTLFDAAAVAWGTVGLVVAAVLGQVFGADPFDYRADLIATLPFLLYLPAKDACARFERGPHVVAGALLWLGLFATVQSAVLFREVITGATEIWHIADARFSSTETSITAAFLLCFAGLTVARGTRVQVVLLGLVGALLGGLILTKSRAFWVATMLGLIALWVSSRPQGRRRMLVSTVLGLAALTAFALAFFSSEALLIVSGAANRLLTLSTAVTQDISLLNRLVESEAVWERIRQNPVLGYGWGVQVSHFSLLNQTTTHWAFFHNGYLALWMKTGLWGLALMAFVWGGAALRGIGAARSAWAGRVERAVALGAVATLTAFTLTAYTSNPFSIFDPMLVVTLTLAIGHGVADRVAWRRAAAERTATEAGAPPPPHSNASR